MKCRLTPNLLEFPHPDFQAWKATGRETRCKRRGAVRPWDWLVLAAVIGVAMGLLFQQAISGCRSSLGWGRDLQELLVVPRSFTLAPVLTGAPVD